MNIDEEPTAEDFNYQQSIKKRNIKSKTKLKNEV